MLLQTATAAKVDQQIIFTHNSREDMAVDTNAQGMAVGEELMDEENETTEVLDEKKRKETGVAFVTAAPALKMQGQQFHVAVSERDNTLILDAEMPMLHLESLVMTVDESHRLLTISGERIAPARKRARIEKESILVDEINSSMFWRQVEIPQGYDVNQVSTLYKDGALTISFKKKVEKNSSPRNQIIPKTRKGVCVLQ